MIDMTNTNTLTISSAPARRCTGRHCAHDAFCLRHAQPQPIPAGVPWSRGLTYCTCPPTWHAIIPPPPCAVHPGIRQISVTCDTASASSGSETTQRYYLVGPAL